MAFMKVERLRFSILKNGSRTGYLEKQEGGNKKILLELAIRELKPVEMRHKKTVWFLGITSF